MERTVAIVGVGAILPDAPDARTFWENIKGGRYSVSEVPRDRWDPAEYWDPDPRVPDRTYSKIGGWVREFHWDLKAWHIAIPPKVVAAMDLAQQWAVACTHDALEDYGFPARSFDRERTAVILGNAMAGEKHYQTNTRIVFPDYAAELGRTACFDGLEPELRARMLREFRERIGRRFPEITEDTMPGELANCMAGRIANIFDLHGPNYVVDAACASALAAMDAAVEGLIDGEFDLALTGGVDRNMGAATFVKFCKIGALSATGTRPYAEGADGFVMGEGAAIFLLKRLADAERDGDHIYALVRGIGGSSDGKGKGITAPNPTGQRLAIRRAWENAGLDPATAGLIEGHGTSTRVGDVVEVESLAATIGLSGPRRSIALGSVKSNLGHLKGAAGAAGILKAALSLSEKVLPPSLGFHRPNPNIRFEDTPFHVNTELRPWESRGGVRRAGVSAFGFGGTNFHVVLEEYLPGGPARSTKTPARVGVERQVAPIPPASSLPRGVLLLGAADPTQLAERAAAVASDLSSGSSASLADLHQPERLAVVWESPEELAEKLEKARDALAREQAAVWRSLRARGIFRGSGPAGKVAFLYTGQGSQYVNMLSELAAAEPIVRETLDEADRVMEPLLGKPLTAFLFADPRDPAAMAAAEESLKQTAVTQPSVLTVDVALTRWLRARGFEPDLVIGHSLGEYGALVAAGVLSFADALLAVSARGREMARVSVADNGKMAAVFAPLDVIERVLSTVEGYTVVANKNSNGQAVIGGASDAVERAVARFEAQGIRAALLPVSHAFHTSIVAPATEPLRQTLSRLTISPPRLPVVANVHGELYPTTREEIIDLLAKQVSSPVEFVRGLETLYREGARTFVEVGPKRALQGFVDDVFAGRPEVQSLFTNHPKSNDLTAVTQTVAGLYAAGHAPSAPAADHTPGQVAPSATAPLPAPRADAPPHRPLTGAAAATSGPGVVITGAGLGLPGLARVFDDRNVEHALRGEQLIDVIPTRFRRAMADKHIVRLVKSEDGDARFEAIDHVSAVVKLAARAGTLDLEQEFGVPRERVEACDVVTQLAIGAGLEALRDAGIPLVMHTRTTSKGTKLPDRFMLPESMRDDTGVIFASAFPGLDAFEREVARYHDDRARRRELADLERLRHRIEAHADKHAIAELDAAIAELREEQAREAFAFDRRFLFRVLAMGHSQLAELIGARGPNTQVNAACASTTQAVSLAEDWIRSGRARRVLLVSADNVTSDRLLEWMGAGFLASGAAATDENVDDAALPFDRRRHGMIMGMGAAALVVERADSAKERGLRPICELLSTITANSAYHGTRLDESHIIGVMEQLVRTAEARFGVRRAELAREAVFVSHETYTPARGGSASAEVHALRAVFGEDAAKIVMANTKGFTGHAMGAGIEDVVAVKILETGLVPPVVNLRERDPDLGPLLLSEGGSYPVRYALRLAAGFGSQVSMSLSRWIPAPGEARTAVAALGYSSRIDDRRRFDSWIESAGGERAELEIVRRTLRVRSPLQAVTAAAAVPALPAVGALPEPAQAPAAAIARAPATPAATTPAPEPTASRATSAATSTVTTPAPTPPPAPPRGLDEELRARIMDIVTEKTGYPADMLDPDLDLEADLGIDTVKQAELLAAVRAEWNIPRDEGLKLRDFPTLNHVVGFVRARRPDLEAPPARPVEPPQAPAVEPPPAAPAPADPVRARVLELVTEKTGYPADMLDPELDLEADLGIDTVKQAELFATVRKEWSIPRDEGLKLRDFPTLNHVVGFVYSKRPDLAPGARAPDPGPISRRVPKVLLRPPLDLCKSTGVPLDSGSRVLIVADRGGAGAALASMLGDRGVEHLLLDPGLPEERLASEAAAFAARGSLTGVYWLPALDPEGALEDLEPAAWKEAVRTRFKALYETMRALYDAVRAKGTFLVSATRLGGRHGYDAAGACCPLGGAVTGFTKAYARERPEVLVKAVDFGANAGSVEIASALVEETLGDPGAVEIGREPGLRSSITLREEAAVDGRPGLTLGRDTVFVVTGAAGSIVSAIIRDLAEASGGRFHLLDLIPPPDEASPDLARVRSDRDGLRRELFDRARARGERVTPATVERQLAQLERGACLLDAMQAIRARGGRVTYASADLRRAEDVARALEPLGAEAGRVDVLIHAAGLEISKLLPDKERAELDLVFDVKADGWYHLARALRGVPLGAAVCFTSIAGRFGNGGQTDYSAANDLLAKVMSSLPCARPGARGIAIDWTAWANIGMAARGSIPQMMALAGIDMLPPEVGVPIVRTELTLGARSGEVLIAGSLGALSEERDPSGGLILDGVPIPQGSMVSRVTAASLQRGIVVEATLDPSREPFLFDHRIDGTPVLPGVMGLEAFTEAALLLAPGWRAVAIEGVRFLAPFKFHRNEPRVIEVEVLLELSGDELLAHAALIGRRKLAQLAEPSVTTHFTAVVRLTRKAASERPLADRPASLPVDPVSGGSIYRAYFHGPAFQVLAEAQLERERAIARMAGELPPLLSSGSGSLVAAPRCVEALFQAAGLLEIARKGTMGLPDGLRSLELLDGPPPSDGAWVSVTWDAGRDTYDGAVLGPDGRTYVALTGYRTSTLPGALPEALVRELTPGGARS